MRKEIVIRMHTSSQKGNSKAIKVAAAVTGVESVTIAGEDKKLLLVVGVGIDSNTLTEKLRKKVGRAEVVELRTVDADDLAGLVIPSEHAYRYHPAMSPSPYKQRDPYYGGGGGGGYYPQARDHNYHNAGGPYAARTTDYYGGGGGGYPAAQYQQQQAYMYYPSANSHTVVHHQYNDDPNSCSIM